MFFGMVVLSRCFHNHYIEAFLVDSLCGILLIISPLLLLCRFGVFFAGGVFYYSDIVRVAKWGSWCISPSSSFDREHAS